MIEFFQNLNYAAAGDVAWVSLAWITTGSLLLLGLAGTLIPSIPGHLFILFAAISHRVMLGAESGVEWWTFAVLGTLLIISQALEFMSGAMGTRWFGGSKWGAFGALIGGFVGMFFMPFGLFLGPLFGTMLFEFFFGKHPSKSEVNNRELSESETLVITTQAKNPIIQQGGQLIEKSKSSTKSGVGTLFGVITGMVIKIIIGIVMVLWFMIDVIWI